MSGSSRQVKNSFTAGELAPEMLGRADLRAYANGAARLRNVTIVDVATPMLNADGQPRPELFGPDSLHMTRAGYDLWRGIVAPYLD